jgi:hypothetical protein
MLEYALRAFGVPPARARLLVTEDESDVVADSDRR